MNLFYNLPQELQSLIFEYDNTYKEYFSNNVLKNIQTLKIYKNKYDNTYIIIDESTSQLAVTNNLHNPFYLIKYARWSKKNIQRQIKKKILVSVFPNDKSHQNTLEEVTHRYSQNMLFMDEIFV